MAVLPLSSESNTKEALRQIDLNFRSVAAEIDSLKKRISELESNS